jgi:hypothetical protein
MRILILAVLPLAALLAQAPPSAEPAQPTTEAPAEAAPPAQAGQPTKPQALSKSQRDANRQRLQKFWNELNARRSEATVTTPGAQFFELRPGQPCAVPLKNALSAALAKPVPDPLPVTPGNPGAVALKEAPKPAPSCDDVGR